MIARRSRALQRRLRRSHAAHGRPAISKRRIVGNGIGDGHSRKSFPEIAKRLPDTRMYPMRLTYKRVLYGYAGEYQTRTEALSVLRNMRRYWSYRTAKFDGLLIRITNPNPKSGITYLVYNRVKIRNPLTGKWILWEPTSIAALRMVKKLDQRNKRNRQ